jgi:two-component system cell cycle sensor histidine kinase/response regulator CckA
MTQTILLVDDDDAVRGLLARVLRSKGYEVLEASSGGDAERISHAHAGPVHLLVCDVLMVGLSGPELAERLSGARPDLRLLMMSGDPTMESALDDRLAHAEFLGKPFSAQKLVENVRQLLAS